jgi:hypothetical protein
MADARRAKTTSRRARTVTHGALDEFSLRARVSPERGAPALDLATALALTQARHGIDFTRSRARAGIARGHLIEVIVELPGGRADADEHEAADALLALMLGDARFADWIGNVSVIAGPRGGSLKVVQARPDADRFFPLADLPATIASAVAGVHAGLPDAPLWALGGEQRWYLFELDPDPRAEGSVQADVVLASTFLPELIKCFLSGGPFASVRFTRHGELFAYLEYENHEPDPRRALARRRVLEDALDAALVSERAGRVIGSGMGIRNSYVNFALYELARGVEVVRLVAARVGVIVPGADGKVRFCDATLAD